MAFSYVFEFCVSVQIPKQAVLERAHHWGLIESGACVGPRGVQIISVEPVEQNQTVGPRRYFVTVGINVQHCYSLWSQG